MVLLPKPGTIVQTDQLILYFTEMGSLNNKETQLAGGLAFIDSGSLPG